MHKNNLTIWIPFFIFDEKASHSNPGKTRQGMTRHGKATPGEARRGKTRRRPGKKVSPGFEKYMHRVYSYSWPVRLKLSTGCQTSPEKIWGEGQIGLGQVGKKWKINKQAGPSIWHSRVLPQIWFLALCIFARLFWCAFETLAKQPLPTLQGTFP